MVPWFAGETATGQNLDLTTAAIALGEFVSALHSINTTGGPVKSGTARGVPLSNLDAGIGSLIEELRRESTRTP